MIGMANLPFTYAELQEAVESKRVTKRDHPTLPYSIYNYADTIQYSRDWDDITRACRGLIIDHSGNIIARPWRKFFNLGEVNLPIQLTDPVEIMEKVDGSLGILYRDSPTSFAIATRGSFTSQQAYHATFNLWLKKYAEYYDDAPEQEYMDDYTLLFEIIYPSNRIVINYDGMDDLVLLGAVENATGYYLSPTTAAAMFAWPGPVVEVFEYNTITDALKHTSRPNAEGFVIRSHNFMVKLKQPDYLELHRLVTNLSAKTVWEQLKAGKNKKQIVSSFPDEFHADVEALIDPLVKEHKKRAENIYNKYIIYVSNLGIGLSDSDRRKQFAMFVKKDSDAKYMFLLLDNKPIGDTLWADLKPAPEPTYFEH